MTADYPGAIWMPVPDENVFPGYWGHKPLWICLHKTAGFHTAQEVASFFQTASDKRSAHFIVGMDGTIVQTVSLDAGAGANCCLESGHAPFLPTDINLNLLTISIEHVDPALDNSTPLTDAQKQASFALIKGICERHNIPMRKGDASGGIVGHADIAPVNRARCPGNYPWDELFAYLNNGGLEMIDLNTPGVANYFEDAGDGRWRCKHNGLVIFGGILKFYRSFGNADLNGLTYLGLPETNEIYPAQYPGVAIQRFERGVLVYDPQHKVDNPPGSSETYLMHLYSGPGQDPRIDALTKQLADVQARISDLQAELAKLSPTPELAVDCINALKDLKPLVLKL
jgi:hypothetical protein